ncbi:MAG: C_GCAxxG_C_C family protein [Ruminococcus sp.]|nr:C_GCAxxG_C_C family protein [Ruminococcus sp.]
MTHEEKALSYFSDKFHCSQSVLAAYSDEIGLTEEQALKISCCFNSGMRSGEVCGACSGALMVLGMIYGQSDKNDTQSRAKSNQMAECFLERFKKTNGTYICNEILGCDIKTQQGREYALSHQLFTTTCRNMVSLAVSILEEIL